jgi:hypothetical protein
MENYHFQTGKSSIYELKKKPVCKSWSQKQIMWFPSGGLHIYVSALDSELFELELVASTSELLSATSYPYISVEKVSFSSFFFREQHLFTIPWWGHFETWQKSLTVLLGKLTHLWNRLLSGQWLGTQRTWDEWSAVSGFLWAIGHSDWYPDVVQRSFRGRSEVVWEPRKMAK